MSEIKSKNTYICECGCNVEFDSYSLGWDIYFIGTDGTTLNYIFTESRMVNDSWNNYIDMDKFTTWGDLWSFITECQKKQTSNIMLHLYNQYKDTLQFYVPINAKLSLEYIY